MQLATVDISKGPTEVVVTGIANNLNIGALAIIPLENQSAEEPVITPAPSSKGCGGSIVASASLISLVALSTGAFLIFKRRRED